MLEPSSSEDEDYDTNQNTGVKHTAKYAASQLNNTQLFNYHFKQQQQIKQNPIAATNLPLNNLSNVSNLQNVSSIQQPIIQQQIKPVANESITQFNSQLSNTKLTNVPRTTINTTITNQANVYSASSNDDQFSKKIINKSSISAQQTTILPTSTANDLNKQPLPQVIDTSISRTSSLRTYARRCSIISQTNNNETTQQHQNLTATSSDVLPVSAINNNTQTISNSANQTNLISNSSLQQQQTQQSTNKSNQLPSTNNQIYISPVTANSNLINSMPPSQQQQQHNVLIGTDGNIINSSNSIILAQQPTNQIHTQQQQLNTAQQMNTGASVAVAIANAGGINYLGQPMLKNQTSSIKNDFNNNPFNSLTLQMIKQNSTNIAGSVGLVNQGSLTTNTILPANLSSSGIEQTEDEQAIDREEQQHKISLQLYVFTVRCVSYPFNAKQAIDMPKRAFKVNEPQLELIKTRIRSLVKGELTINSVLTSSKSKSSLYSGSNAIASSSTASGSSNQTAIASAQANSYVNSPVCEKLLLDILAIYNEHFLSSDRLNMLVNSGGSSLADFRYIFRKFAEKKIKRSTEIDTYSKEQVLNSFMMKFDLILPSEDQSYTQHYGNYLYYFITNKKFTTTTSSKSNQYQQQQHLQQSNADVVLTKEQIYDMFSRILSIKKFEHQLLFNALQLDNADEQAAAIRRELDGRLAKCNEMEVNRKLIPKFVLKEMDSLYLDELRSTISQLMLNLESLPVTKGGTDSKYGLQKLKRYNQRNQTSALAKAEQINDEPETNLSKNDVVLSFKIEVVVIEAKGLKNLQHNKVVYCTMEVEGNEKLQTDNASAQKPFWDCSADFVTSHPLPSVKIKLFTKSQKLISLEDKELGKLIIKPTPLSNKSAEWYQMTVPKNAIDQDLKIKVIVRMDKPNNMKHCGYLWGQGKQWRKWKSRYFILIQVSQYTFAMCSFREKKNDPTEMLNLDGYTVDYIEPIPDLAELGGKYFFNAVKEGDSVYFACDDENECALWVQALYRATGQSHKPTPLSSPAYNALGRNLISRMDGDADRAKKHGMDEYIQADPCSFNHHQLFRILQNLTLTYRLSEPVVSLGWLSPSQTFVLEEYSSRYGVRSCFRQLCFLTELLDRAESGYSIDPHLINLNFSFCSSFVHGLNETPVSNQTGADIRPDGMAVATVTHEEKEIYLMVKDRLMALIEFQLTNFRYCFPFGRPDGQLKATLTLLERVLMKDVISPTPSSEVRSYVKRCLESAALINYTAVSKQTHIEESINDTSLLPNIKLNELIVHAEICVDMVKENNEFYAEFSDLLVDHCEIFFSLFIVDMNAVLDEQPPNNWDSFSLFTVLNNFLVQDENLCGGRFHHFILETFFPLLVRYLDLMESSIDQSLKKAFEKEKWIPVAGQTNVGTTASASSTVGSTSSKITSTEIDKQTVQAICTCASTDELYWKLQALQTFLKQLNWPDKVYSSHLTTRLSKMASEKIIDAVRRTMNAFLGFKRKSLTAGVAARFATPTDYIIPAQVCIQMNVVHDARLQAARICAIDPVEGPYNQQLVEKTVDDVLDDMIEELIAKLISVLESVLNKLSRYDDGAFIASMLSITQNVSNSGKENARQYVDFVHNNIEQLRLKLSDESWVLNLFYSWYDGQMILLNKWLMERPVIVPIQSTAIKLIFKKIRGDFDLMGLDQKRLNTVAYKTIFDRLKSELSHEAVKNKVSNKSSLGVDEFGDPQNESDPQSPSASSSNSGGDGNNNTSTLGNLSNALFSSKDENSEDKIGKVMENVMDKIGSVTRITGFAKLGGGLLKF